MTKLGLRGASLLGGKIVDDHRFVELRGHIVVDCHAIRQFINLVARRLVHGQVHVDREVRRNGSGGGSRGAMARRGGNTRNGRRNVGVRVGVSKTVSRKTIGSQLLPHVWGR